MSCVTCFERQQYNQTVDAPDSLVHMVIQQSSLHGQQSEKHNRLVLHLQKYQQRALQGEYDCQLDFGCGGDIWVVRLALLLT